MANERAPRRLLALLLLALSLPVAASAMGDFDGEGPTTRIPEPPANFRARVIDTTLTEFVVEKASFDGHIHLTGAMGKARVSVPFDKIDKVLFEPADEGKAVAVITLKGGGTQNLLVGGRMPCFGAAEFGNVTVEVRDLREVVFLGRVD